MEQGDPSLRDTKRVFANETGKHPHHIQSHRPIRGLYELHHNMD
jgi:hypothetical protein